MDNNTKTCKQCKQLKNIGNFGKSSKHKDGHLSRCKECQKQHRLNTLVKLPHITATTKACNICKEIKPVELFNKNIQSRDGLQSGCRECQNNKRKQWGLNNASHIKSYRDNWYKHNKQYYVACIAHKRLNNICPRCTQPLSDSQYATCKSCRNKGNTYRKNKRHVDQSYKLSCYLRNRLRKALKAGSAIKDLGCSIEQLQKHLESQFEEGMTWDNWGVGDGRWHIDHIIPLHKLDLSDRDEFLEACHYTNLRPMWGTENCGRTYNDVSGFPTVDELTDEQKTKLIDGYTHYQYCSTISDITGINMARVKTLLDTLEANGELP